MYLLGSKSKDEIIKYLSKNPHKSVQEISKTSGVGYKHTSKILSEFVEKGIVDKKGKLFFLKSEFIDFIKKFSDTIMKIYTKEFLLKGKSDVYNFLSAMYPEEKISKKIDNLIENWIVEKLNDWYSKYYDPEDKEYKKLEKIIFSKFKKNINILEIGCGTGRLTFKLAKKFSKITAIDKEEKYIKYCKRISKDKNIDFEASDVLGFNSKIKFDVVVLSWMGLHYQKDADKILKKVKSLLKKKGMLIILDAYHETEYVKILEMIRPSKHEDIKMMKKKLDDSIIKEFGNINKELLFTEYKFDNIKEVINNFKIELTLEESHVWTKEDEEKLKIYLSSKKDPLTIQEGLWMTVVEN